MQRPGTLAIMTLAATLLGCTGINVKQDYDPDANFRRLKDYAWQPSQEPQEGKTVADSSLIDSRIRKAMDRVLTQRGYRKTTENTADFLVAYYYKVNEKTESTRGGVRTGVGFGTGSHGSFTSIGIGFGLGDKDREYDEGVLTIDVINPRTRKLMWRGMAEQRLVWNNDPQKTTQRINETVETVLSKFPPNR